MQIITYKDLELFTQREVGCALDVSPDWGLKEVEIYPPKRERVYFRLIKDLGRNKHKSGQSKKEPLHMLYPEMVYKLIHHFQKRKVFPLGRVKVIP